LDDFYDHKDIPENLHETKLSWKDIKNDLKSPLKIKSKKIMERIMEASDESMPTSTDYEPEHYHQVPISTFGKKHGPSKNTGR